MPFGNKLLIFGSFWCLLFPVIASVNGFVQGDNPSFLSQKKNECIRPFHHSKFGLAIADGDYTSQLASMECHWRTRIYKPILRRKVSQKTRVHNAASVLQGLLLLCLYALLLVVSNIAMLFGFVVTWKLAPLTDILDIDTPFLSNESLVMFVLLVLLSVELCVSKAFSKQADGSSKETSKHRKRLKGKASVVTFARAFNIASLLLILSGDIELNPGPTPPSTPKLSQGDDVFTEDDEIPKSKPIPESIKTVSGNEMKLAEDDIEAQITSTLDLTKSDSGQSLPQLHLECEDKQALSSNSTLSGERKMATLVSSNENEHDFHIFEQQKCNETLPDLELALPQNAPVSESAGNRNEQPSLVQEQTQVIKDILRDHKMWIEGVGFKSNYPYPDQERYETLSTDLHKILIAANKLFRNGERCFICVRCGNDKQKKKEVKISHVFPECMLEVYRKVHCSGKHNFIHDFSTFTHKAKEYGYNLLCTKCEKTGAMEPDLRAVYLLILSHETTLSLSNVNSWFPLILTDVMFRGILVCGSLEEILTNYGELFFSLWQYVLGKGKTNCDIRLFLLPLSSISTSNTHFLYALEFLLRNPAFPELYKSDDAGTFLYCHFDCFHIVLPLDSKSKDYFDKHLSVDIHADRVVCERSTYPTVKLCTDNDSHTFEYCGDLSNYFPDVLIKVTVGKHDLLWKLSKEVKREGHQRKYYEKLDYIKFDHTSRMLVDHFPEKAPSYSPPLALMATKTGAPETCIHYETDSKAGNAGNVYTRVHMESKTTRKALVDTAEKYSPLAKPYQLIVKYNELEKRCKEDEDSLTKMTETNKEFEQEIDRLNTEIAGLRTKQARDEEFLFQVTTTNRQLINRQKQHFREREILERDLQRSMQRLHRLKPLITKVAHLENENEQLTLNNARLQEAFAHTSQRVTRLEEDNAQLRSQLAILQKGD